ncbi:MAG: glycosyltransferase [bacterium]
MKTSIVICTKARINDLLKCMDSILLQTRPPGEIIVVDGSEKDTISNILKIKMKNNFNIDFSYIQMSGGLTHQRNAGINVVKNDIVLFLDDDVILAPDYLFEIMKIYENDKKGEIRGLTGCIEKMPKPSHKQLFFQRLFLLPQFRDGKFLDSGQPTWIWKPTRLTEIEVMLGCNMSFRREIFYEYSFDEGLKGYCYMEDDDFSYRVSRKHKLYQTPFAKLEHSVSSISRDNIAEFHRMQILNYFLFFKKNIPKNIKSVLCFSWSTIGIIIVEGVFDKNRKIILKGFLGGILDIIRTLNVYFIK